MSQRQHPSDQPYPPAGGRPQQAFPGGPQGPPQPYSGTPQAAPQPYPGAPQPYPGSAQGASQPYPGASPSQPYSATYPPRQPYPGQPAPPYSGSYAPSQPSPVGSMPPGHPGAAALNGQPTADPYANPYAPAAGRAIGSPGLPPGAAPLNRPVPSVTIDSFKPPKRNYGMIGLVIAVMASILIGIAAYNANLFAAFDDEPTAQASPEQSTTPSGALPFEGPSGSKGYWQITKTNWTSSQVTLTISITMTSGGMGAGFYAYDAAGTKVLDPESTSTLRNLQLADGQTVEGTLVFTLPRGDGTVILTDRFDRPVSGLAFKK